MEIDPIKSLVLEKLVDGEWDFDLTQVDGDYHLVIDVTGKKDEHEHKHTTETGQRRRVTRAQADQVVYDALPGPTDDPIKIDLLSDRTDLNKSTIGKALRRLRMNGKVEETTGQQKHRKFRRKPITVQVCAGIR